MRKIDKEIKHIENVLEKKLQLFYNFSFAQIGIFFGIFISISSASLFLIFSLLLENSKVSFTEKISSLIIFFLLTLLFLVLTIKDNEKTIKRLENSIRGYKELLENLKSAKETPKLKAILEKILK